MSFILDFLGLGGKKPEKKADEIKVNKWDSSALKNALDDSVKKWYKDKWSSEKLIVSNRLIDIRIGLTLAGVLVAGFACLYDYLHPFPASYWVIVICASLYFTFMTALTVFSWYMERGCFFEALEKDKLNLDPDNRIMLASNMHRYSNIYSLSLTYTDGKSQRSVVEELSKSVTEYFDDSGVLHQELFEAAVAELHETAVRNVREGKSSSSKLDNKKSQ